MKDHLLTNALLKITAGILLVGILLFLPAGTMHWKNGILFMVVLFVPMFIAGLVMYYKAPDLLRSRLSAKESQSEQRDVIRYSGLMFIASFLLAGFNARYHWMHFPKPIVILGVITFLLSYALFAEVLRENAYLSRTIEVVENQKVIDTGLYGIVRHPMYFATIFLFLSMPLILDSPISFVIMLVYIPIIMKRIKNEEMVLEKELDGYQEYQKKVKWRIIPYIY